MTATGHVTRIAGHERTAILKAQRDAKDERAWFLAQRQASIETAIAKQAGEAFEAGRIDTAWGNLRSLFWVMAMRR